MEEKLCKYCKLPFQPKNSNEKFCNRQHTVKCPICGSVRNVPKSKLNYILKYGPSACSYKCRVVKTQRTSMIKYGCKAPGNNPIAREKAKETTIKRFGVPYAMMNKSVRDKLKSTIVDLYGVENASQCEAVKEKRAKTNKQRYGDVMPFNRPESYEKQHKTIEEKYGVMYASLIPHFAATNNHVSKINLKFKSKLEKVGIQSITEKTIKNLIYDLHITDSNTLIEVNPTYTHNIIGNHWNPDGLEKYYHRDKTQLAEDNGFQCIHIWDWDNIDKIVKWLKPRKTIDASEFDVYKLDLHVANEFLDKYHIFGSHRGQVLCIGLVKDNQIYQIMTFCKSIYNKNYYAQLCRWCTRPEYEICGGYDKLSSYASAQFGINNVIAYVDRSKFTGKDLEDIGMKLLNISPPRKIWSKGKKFINSSLIVSGKSNYKSEDELLKDGWLPIYDCGQRVYVG